MKKQRGFTFMEGLIALMVVIGVLMIIAASVGSCRAPKQIENRESRYKEYWRKDDYLYFRIVTIDGCEYIHTSKDVVIHKGNCTNSIHAHNQ